MSDHFENRKVVGIVEQDRPDTFKDGFAAANCNLAAYVDSMEFAAESETYERNVASPTYSQDVDIIARESGTIRARAEVRGSGTSKTTVPSWAPWVEGCGAQRATLQMFPLDEATSVDLDRWAPGVLLTQAVSLATAYLVDVDTDTDEVLIHTVTGTPQVSQNWTGTSAAGAFTIGQDTTAPVVHGLTWFPRSAIEVFSQGTLTLDTNPVDLDGDTMTIGSVTYTFKDTVSAANDIAIGATVAATQANIVAAINGSGTPGTEYGTGTVQNPDAKMDPFATDVAIVTARISGSVGDAIATTETFTAATNVFDAATLGTYTAGRAYHYSIGEFKPFGTNGRSTRHAIKNAVGDCEISGDNIGAPMMFDFNMKGCEHGEHEVATPTPITYETNAVPLFRGVDYKITGDAAAPKAHCKINSFRFRFGNDIEADEYATADEPGIVKYDVVGRKPSGEHSLRLLEPSVKSFFADYKNHRTGRLVFKNGKTAEGNIVEMRLLKIQYQNYGHENVRRKVHGRLSFGVKSPDISIGDNEWFLIKR